MHPRTASGAAFTSPKLTPSATMPEAVYGIQPAVVPSPPDQTGDGPTKSMPRKQTRNERRTWYVACRQRESRPETR